MRMVKVALGVVAVVAALAAGVGVVVGLTGDASPNVEGRPFIYWMIAFSLGMTGWLGLPELVSWFVNLERPLWHRRHLMQDHRGTPLPAGTTMLATARRLEPRQRQRLARAIIGYGLFYIVVSIPMQLIFGLGAMRSASLRLEESVPLMLALAAPVTWTAVLVVRGPHPRPGPRGRSVAVRLFGLVVCGVFGFVFGVLTDLLRWPVLTGAGVALVVYAGWLIAWEIRSQRQAPAE